MRNLMANMKMNMLHSPYSMILGIITCHRSSHTSVANHKAVRICQIKIRQMQSAKTSLASEKGKHINICIPD